MAEKLSYAVPQKVRDNAKRGLKLREETGARVDYQHNKQAS